MDKERVENFAYEKALLMNHVRYDDINFASEENYKKIKDWEGQYQYNGGVVAFVVNGCYYATPFVDDALKVLKESGFNCDKGIFVPFNALDGFPGRLGPESEKRMWVRAYYPQSKTFEPASKIVKYYREVQRIHSGYNWWKELLYRSGALGKDENGRRITLDDQLELMLKEIWNHREEYRIAAAKELGIYDELYLNDEQKRGTHK